MSETQEKVLGFISHKDPPKLYVKNLLIRQSISILVIKIILVDIITAAIFLTSHSVLFNTDISSSLEISVNSYNTIIFLALVAGKIFLTLYLVFEWLNECYELRPDAIIYRRGVFFKHTKKHDLVLIRYAKIEYGLVARLLNYGNIHLYDIRLEKEIDLYMIHNPVKYLHIIEGIIPDLEVDKDFFRNKDVEEPIED